MNTVPPAFCPECGHFLSSDSGRYGGGSDKGNLISYKCHHCGAGNVAVDFIDRGLVWYVKPQHLAHRRMEAGRAKTEAKS